MNLVLTLSQGAGIGAKELLLSSVGYIEVFLWAAGTSATDEQTLTIRVAVRYPLSQGRVHLKIGLTRRMLLLLISPTKVPALVK